LRPTQRLRTICAWHRSCGRRSGRAPIPTPERASRPHTEVDDKTIVFILCSLSVLAYYADPFGWNPNERHGGTRKSGTIAALLFLVAGLAYANHADMIPTETLLAEYATGLDRPVERVHAYSPGGLGDATAWLSEIFGEAASALDQGARHVAASVGEYATEFAAAADPEATPKS